MSEEKERLEGKDPGHEPLSVSIRGIAIGTVGLVALIAVTLLAMGPLARLMTSREAVDSFLELPVEAPQTTVGLNPNQAQDRLTLEEQQREWLGEYAWLDEEEEMARIPIERAMQIIRERGLGVAAESGGSDAANAPPDREGESL